MVKVEVETRDLSALKEEERQVRQYLHLLFQDYCKQIKPWVDRIVELEALQGRCTVFTQECSLGSTPSSPKD